jgi:MFS family permease
MNFAARRLPAFRNLVAGRVISMFGNAIAPIALAFAVLDLTGSVRDLGLVVGARSIFNVLFVLVGGVLADRLPRQLVMVGASVLAGLSQALTAGLLFTHHATVVLIAVIAAFNGVAAALNQPATAAVVAQTIPDELRRPGNALNRLSMNLAQIVGAAVGGLLVAAFGSAWGIAIDGVTFLLAAVLYSLVRVPSYRADAVQRSTIFRELREGWSEFASRTWVWVVVLGFMFFNMAGVASISVLGPALADVSFGRRVWGFILAANVAGALVGGLVAMRLRVRRLLLVGLAGCAGIPLSYLALAGLSSVALLLVLFFLAGFGVEQFGVAWEVSVQEHVPADKLARVYSYDMLGSFLAIPLGQVLVGPLAVAVGVRTSLVIASMVTAVSVLAMLAIGSVRRLEHRPGPATSTVEEAVAVGQ